MSRNPKRNQTWQIEEPLINLTPLIDVVFVILIMFIVIAPLLEIDHIELASGPTHSEHLVIPAQETSPISLHVRGDNRLFFNQKEISLSDLVPLLKQAKAQYPLQKPLLFLDKRAHFGLYQSIKNSAEAAGFEQLDIILQPG